MEVPGKPLRLLLTYYYLDEVDWQSYQVPQDWGTRRNWTFLRERPNGTHLVGTSETDLVAQFLAPGDGLGVQERLDLRFCQIASPKGYIFPL